MFNVCGIRLINGIDFRDDDVWSCCEDSGNEMFMLCDNLFWGNRAYLLSKKLMFCAIFYIIEDSVVCFLDIAWRVGRGGRRDKFMKVVIKCICWYF